MFEDIALTIIAFDQNSLLTSTASTQKDSAARLNGYAISSQSQFIQTLISKLLQPSPELVNTVFPWLTLRTLEELNFQSPEIESFIEGLIQSLIHDKIYEPCIIGVLLLIYANGSQFTNVEEIIEILASYPRRLTSDIGVLEGLERLLQRMSRYSHSNFVLTYILQAPQCKIHYKLSHFSSEKIFHIPLIQFVQYLFEFWFEYPISPLHLKNYSKQC